MEVSVPVISSPPVATGADGGLVGARVRPPGFPKIYRSVAATVVAAVGPAVP